MKKNFLVLAESILQRFQRTGFLIGDVVEFIDGYQNTDTYKQLHPSIKAHVDTLANGDINVKVVNIKNHYPSRQPGNEQNTIGDCTLDLALDYGGGRRVDVVTVPADLVMSVNHYPNLDPVPDALKRKNLITIKPEPVGEGDEENYEAEHVKQTETTKQDLDGDYKRSDHSLNNTNTKIPSSPADGDPKPEPSESYTKRYLPRA